MGGLKRATQHGDGLGLQDRLQKWNLHSVEVRGDGNCQFRALAANFWGDEEHHSAVRQASIRYLTRHATRFQVYFETTSEFYKYLRDMAQPGTWGDELTLIAAVQAYGCPVHVVTSEAERWYLIYQPPADFVVDPWVAVCPQGLPLPKRNRIAFLSYISQKHYNALTFSVDGAALARSVSTVSTSAGESSAERRPSCSTVCSVSSPSSASSPPPPLVDTAPEASGEKSLHGDAVEQASENEAEHQSAGPDPLDSLTQPAADADEAQSQSTTDLEPTSFLHENKVAAEACDVCYSEPPCAVKSTADDAEVDTQSASSAHSDHSSLPSEASSQPYMEDMQI